MTPTGTCEKCGTEYVGWALEHDTTCPRCGGKIKVEGKDELEY